MSCKYSFVILRCTFPYISIFSSFVSTSHVHLTHFEGCMSHSYSTIRLRFLCLVCYSATTIELIEASILNNFSSREIECDSLIMTQIVKYMSFKKVLEIYSESTIGHFLTDLAAQNLPIACKYPIKS